MKKLFKSNRLPMLSALCGSLLLLGCTNADYDFDKVDYTLGFGSGEITLPSNNSVNIMLDDILDLGNSDLIKVEANGDYVFKKEQQDKIESVDVNIKAITNSGMSSSLPFPEIELPAAIMPFVGMEITLADYGIDPLTKEDDISLMDYSFDVPETVEKLNYVTLANGGTNLTVSLKLPAIKTLSLVVNLPKQLVMTYENTFGTFDTNNNTLTINNHEVVNEKLNLNFKVKRINTEMVNHKFTLNSKVHLSVAISALRVPAQPKIQLSGNVALDDMTIIEANGTFKPTIDPQEVGSATINSLPDFLTDSKVVADIDNPRIELTVTSNLPLGAKVNANIKSVYLDGSRAMVPISGDNAIDIQPNKTSKIMICRKIKDITPSEYDQVIVLDNLSNIVKKLREKMKIQFDITSINAYQTGDVTIKLGEENGYKISPDYKFMAPLALGDNAVIIYVDTEKDWHKDIKDIELSKASTILLTANAENGVPADMEINITPVGTNGQSLTNLIVKPINNKVAAGATSSKVEYEISDADGKGLSLLDGVQYELSINAPADNAQKYKVLNKTQKVKLTDITLKVLGKVVVDAN